ncbi:YciI family protein [Nocardioides sp.]|jgi:hypothetical protein|uniref:YciI family protein n=1 Tax=Nocardioides sp. TaxID=35761 RepID=UPI00262ECEB5|nr:YciI family protein [Nocardioides sp.]
MPQYLIATYDEPTTRTMTPEEMAPIYEAVGGLINEAIETGIFVFAGGLEGKEAITVVDPRGSATVVTDGPFIESREYLGGFTVINVPDLDAALAFGTRMAEASRLPQEVRPFQAEPEAE